MTTTAHLNPPAFTTDPNDRAYYVGVAAYMTQQFGGEWEVVTTAHGFFYAARKASK